MSERIGALGFLRRRVSAGPTAVSEALAASALDRGEGAARWEYARILFVAAAALFAYRVSWRSYAPVDVLGIGVACAAGYPIFKRGLMSRLEGALSAELPLRLAIVASVCIGQSSMGLAVFLSFLITRTIRQKIIMRGRRSLAELTGPSIHSLSERAPRVRISTLGWMADWIPRFFVGLSLGAALFAFLTTGKAETGISVLIIGTACGFTSAGFVSLLRVMLRRKERGVFINTIASVEELATVDVVILHKTADSAFCDSEGVQSPSHNKSHADVRQTMCRLNRMNIETVLFTSDLEPVGRQMADRTGVNLVEAELFPEDEVCKVAALRRRFKHVAMLSDGVNAGPALLEADIGVIIGPRARVPDDPRNVAMASGDIRDFVEALAIARRTKRIMAINLVLSILVSSLGIGLAMGERLQPFSVIVIRFLLELALLTNAARLLPSASRVQT